MFRIALTKLEVFLLLLVTVIMLACILMCICVFLIVPRSWVSDKYVANTGNRTYLIHHCQCDLLTTRNSSREIKKISFSRAEDRRELDATFSRNKIRAFPYLVSLNLPAYIDEPLEMKFACSGVIVARNWVLTGGVCIIENDEYEYLKVRELSDYWSKGGILHLVISASIKTKTQPLALKTKTEFSVGSELSSTPVSPIQNLMSVGWRDPELVRKKFEPFLVDLFTESKCWVCVAGVIKKRDCDFKSTGKPLIANCNYLYGMHCKNGVVQEFLLLPEERHDNWWLFLETPPAERLPVTELFGILEMNVDSCKPYDFARFFQDKRITWLPATVQNLH